MKWHTIDFSKAKTVSEFTIPLTCTCTTTGTCQLCRPPCEYDGQDFFAFIVETPVCLDCWEYYQDQAPLHAGIW